MNKITTAVIALVIGATGFAAAASAEVLGTYVRKGDQVITVHTDDGLLYCTRLSDGFELCHGMAEQADGTWTGKKMKHPDMPKFMTFNGTVTFGDGTMSLKGCAMGNSLCDSEDWPEQ